MNETKAVEILTENLRIFSERSALSEQQRVGCAEELFLRWSRAEPEQTAQERYREFCRLFPDARASDKARLCRHLAPRLRDSERYLGEEGRAAGIHGRVALVRNRYNEEAFSCFSEVLMSAKPSYSPTFSDACEDVFGNRCEFAILPIENTHDGRLFGFYSMLDRYELKICADCALEAENPTGIIRYALIGKHVPDRLPRVDRWNLECSVTARLGEFPTDLLEVAPLFGATPEKIDSLPVLYDDGLCRLYFTFRLSRKEADAFDFYLTMEHPHYTPIGQYPSLTEF